jgi:type IV pilus assembly protein PilW
VSHADLAPGFGSQRGAGLVELLIGMAVGLVVLIALGYFFLGSRQINRTSDDVSRMQESGRNALELMGRAIRQAGYRSDPDQPLLGVAVTGTDGASDAPDTITVQYDAQTGGEANCIGANIASGLVTAAFAIDNVSDPPALTCNGTVVVANVEDMQIDYGIDAGKDGNIEFYKSAPAGAEFGQVAAVRVSLLVRGPTTKVAAGNTQTYNFNGAEVTKTDGYLRQVFTGTFTVRNQAW